jgi:hypothetical protein
MNASLADYQDLVYSPLALPRPPRVDRARLVEWMTWARREGLKRGLNRAERNFEARTGRQYPWLTANVYYADPGPVEASFEAAFPQIARYARRFPVDEVGGIVLLAQRGHAEVHLHTDSDGAWGFRFYLAEGDHEGLYFCMTRQRTSTLPRAIDDWSELLDLERRHYARWQYGNRPFCLNCVRAAHAVDANDCRLGERIACLVLPKQGVNEARLLSLLERSTARFGDAQIWYQ